MSSKNQYVPVIKTPKEIIDQAIATVISEASGKQLGLKTRFKSLNISLGKYFRFGQVYGIGGPSGHGKSTLLNIFIQDFLNPSLNLGKCTYDYIICHHSFEMLPADEELRKASGRLKMSYNAILSSEYDPETEKFNVVDDTTLSNIKEALRQDIDKPIYYFDEPCKLPQIGANVQAALSHYKEKNPDKRDVKTRVVILIDHTLLIEQSEGEYDILQTIRNLAKTVIALKKKGYMVIFISQFNNNIEKAERLKTPEMQYPIKSDFYAQGEIFNACDGVFSIYQPELVGILFYGKRKLHTHLLVHLQVIKMRFGNIGSIWLKNMLNKGTFVAYPREELKEG